MHADKVKPNSRLRTSHWRLTTCHCSSDFLQSLHFVDARNFSQAGDDLLEMLQICDVEDYLDTGLAVGRMSGDVLDVALSVADHSRNALKHAETVVAEVSQLHGLCSWGRLVPGPFPIDATIRF